MWSIFKTFFFLGWISFGGPAAHIGYFRQHFVEKHKWLSDSDYAQIVALSQFLPGPGSSQVGFAVGYQRGGLTGACAAFLGFTLPSVLVMLVLAAVSSQVVETGLYQSIVHGLKLLAVMVVADATLGMYRNFCKTRLTVALCVVTAVALLLFPGIQSQMLVLILAALVGMRYLQDDTSMQNGDFKPSLLPLLLFAVLLFGLPVIARSLPGIALFSDFYQAGSLVFGGGHVVLPLLQGLIGDQVSQDTFMTGYAAAQAVPGPMFTLATFIGYHMSDTPVLGALVATLAVFLPGFLLLLGVLKQWQALAGKPAVSGAITGVNAAVVGLLLAALYQPVFVGAVLSATDMALLTGGFFLHKQLKLSVLWMIVYFILTALFI
jgi:chromate transporter